MNLMHGICTKSKLNLPPPDNGKSMAIPFAIRDIMQREVAWYRDGGAQK